MNLWLADDFLVKIKFQIKELYFFVLISLRGDVSDMSVRCLFQKDERLVKATMCFINGL